MKLDFDQLRRLKDSFHEQFYRSGDTSEQLNEGTMVYSLHMDPKAGSCQVHVQWPYFRNLVANESDCPATSCKCVSTLNGEPWIYWECSVLGVEICTCMYKQDVLNELKLLELPAEYDVCEDDDIESLLALWQNISGWNKEVNK